MARAAALAICLLLALQPGAGLATETTSAEDAKTATVVLETASGSHRFQVEVAATSAQRAQGLMYRRSLPPDAGMLFLYEEPRPLFMWMKNTMIPLDMVFFDAGGTVRHIAANAEPFSERPISSEAPVIGVLELNGGKAAEIGLKVGDRLDYPGGGGPEGD